MLNISVFRLIGFLDSRIKRSKRTDRLSGQFFIRIFSYSGVVRLPRTLSDMHTVFVLDTNGGAEEIRTLARYKPTDGFQDRSLEPLGYCSV